MLFKAPFTNIHQNGIIAVFDEANSINVIKLIEQINGKALVERKMTKSR